MRMHGGGDSEIDGCGNTTAKSTGVGTNEHAAAAIAAPQWAACPAAWHDLRRVPLPSTAPCCKRSPCGRSALPLQWGRRHLPPPVSHSYSFFNALQDLTEEELTQLREEVDKYTVEGDLRRFNALNIKRLKEIGCYRGRRHYNNLPVRRLDRVCQGSCWVAALAWRAWQQGRPPEQHEQRMLPPCSFVFTRRRCSARTRQAQHPAVSIVQARLNPPSPAPLC